MTQRVALHPVRVTDMSNHKENFSPPGFMEQELRSSLEQISTALRGLKFGSVNVIVQDGVVVQIERTEKTRLKNSPRQAP